jgi:hypothetical protein
LIHTVVGDHRGLRVLAHEPFGIAGVRRGEGVCAGGPYQLGVSIVDIMGSVPGDAGMTMLLVVPPVERLDMCPGMFEAGEPVREVRPVLQRLELGLRKGIIVGRPWPGVTSFHAQVRQQLGERRTCEAGTSPTV